MKKNRYPVKQDLNLAQRARKNQNLSGVGVLALVLAVGIALFCKFGVIDQLERVSAARSAADETERQLAQTVQETDRYPEVLSEYQSYTASQLAMNGSVDPMECLDLIQRELLAVSSVSAFTVSDDLIAVELSGVTLQQVSGIYTRLMASDLVSGVQVYTAATNGELADTVAASMTILLQTEGPEEETEVAP